MAFSTTWCVGDDVALPGVDDHAGAAALERPFALAAVRRHVEEAAEERVVEQRVALRALATRAADRDVDHRRRGALDHRREGRRAGRGGRRQRVRRRGGGLLCPQGRRGQAGGQDERRGSHLHRLMSPRQGRAALYESVPGTGGAPVEINAWTGNLLVSCASGVWRRCTQKSCGALARSNGAVFWSYSTSAAPERIL